MIKIELDSDIVVDAILKHASYHGRGSAHDLALNHLGHETGAYVEKFTRQKATLNLNFFKTFPGIEKYLPDAVEEELKQQLATQD